MIDEKQPRKRTTKPDFCVSCGRRRLEGEFRCPECAGADYDVSIIVNHPERREHPGHKLGGIIGRLVRLEPGEILLLKGPKAVGKTSIALTAFAGVSLPWILTNEMSIGKVKSYAERLKVRYCGVSWPFLYELEPPEYEIGGPRPIPEERIDLAIRSDRPRSYVYDSLNGLATPAKVLAAVRELVNRSGGRAVVTSQVTTQDEARGGPTIEHNVDAVVRIERADGDARRAVAEKTRSGPEGSLIFTIDEATGAIGLPRWDRYYSIEGRGPDYEIRSFPQPGGTPPQYAAFLAAARSGRLPTEIRAALPKPPIAVAALDGGALYEGPNRWIEPPDAAARCRFATMHGLSYYSPSDGRLVESKPL